MKTMLSISGMILVFGICLWGGYIPNAGAADALYPCENDLIEVMFSAESQVRLRGGELIDSRTNATEGLNAVLGKSSREWLRICDVPEETVDLLHSRGEANSGRSLYNLNNIYRVRITTGEDVWELSHQLESLAGIDWARPVPKPMPPPLPIDYEPQQGYLDPATDVPSGVDAEFSWKLPGGSGSGVTICDLEYSWNYSHQDISKAVGSQINTNVADPFSDDNHGTAVIGELVSDSNGWGTTGVCHRANLLTCGTYYGTPAPSWNVAGAITLAISNLSVGDVILLEQQWDYNNHGLYIPIEWWGDNQPNGQTLNPVYAAIQTAVANGIHVVEAGGNGGYDTDNITWYGNSGAIIVGAGGASTGPNADRQRLSFSSYGIRFDLQGWGENVVTTGYGYLYNSEGKNLWYRGNFDGTSSASPIVAGVVANCVGYWKGLGWDPLVLSPDSLRNFLIITGTAQDPSVYGNIGPRPDLRQACSMLVTQEIEWADVSQPPLTNTEDNGMGVSAGDYNNDGHIDLYITNAYSTNNLFRNNGDGTFTDVTVPPLDDPNTSKGSAWGDYDNDSDLDLYVANEYVANRLFRNNGDGSFTDVTVSPLNDAGCGEGVAWVDYNNDGGLDLSLANYGSANKLFRNEGGTFVDVTPPPLGNTGSAMGLTWGDYDDDGVQDLFIYRAASETNSLYRNNGGGSFTDVTPVVMQTAGDHTAAEWADFDNDGDLDLYVVDNSSGNRMYRNDGGGNFSDATTGPLGDVAYNFAVTCGDYDNDRDVDIYVTTGYCCNKLFRNEGGMVFVDATNGPIQAAREFSTAGIWYDYDEDGDLDIFTTSTGTWHPNKLFQNKLNNGNHWLHIKLVGVVSNRAAIGARVRVKTGGLWQMREISGGSGYCSQNTLLAEFGLGTYEQADSIIVSWPSGITQLIGAQAGDAVITITEQITVFCGDANSDGQVNVGDAVHIINYVFKGGAAPNPECRGDENDDGDCNVGDAVFLINYVFKGGAAPVEPCCD